MSLLRMFAVLFLSFGLLVPTHEATAAIIDNNAPVVQLRDPANGGCIEAGVELNNCFTVTESLNEWIKNTRQPTASSPLLVEIGPGTFIGPFLCRNTAITLRGAGVERTTLGVGAGAYGIKGFSGCNDLNVQDLGTASGNASGVVWQDGGNSTWTNVIIRGTQFGWNNVGAVTSCSTVHRWRSSLIIAGPSATATGYQDQCGEHWFLGTEIVANNKGSTSNTKELYGLLALGGEYHVYGSNIRALGSATVSAQPPTTPARVTAVYAESATVHIHGTGIDAEGAGPYAVAGITGGSGAAIHANESSYNLVVTDNNSYTRYRLLDLGAVHLHAPYLWEEHPTPPTNIASRNGADMTVETDCAASGCQSTGTETHLLIYNNTCAGAGGPWFDVVTGTCR
jgi:hypothetical protein